MVKRCFMPASVFGVDFQMTKRLKLVCYSVISRHETLKNMLPEVGDLHRSSDVAEPSLMSHRPTAEIKILNH